MQTRIKDSAFLEQISQIGLLVGFEALLSCYGDEMGMLEDMSVAVDDLAFVFIKFIEEEEEEMEPTITTLRLVLCMYYTHILVALVGACVYAHSLVTQLTFE